MRKLTALFVASTLALGAANLAPAALEEVMSMLCWGGFSAQALASKASPLQTRWLRLIRRKQNSCPG